MRILRTLGIEALIGVSVEFVLATPLAIFQRPGADIVLRLSRYRVVSHALKHLPPGRVLVVAQSSEIAIQTAIFIIAAVTLMYCFRRMRVDPVR